MVRVMDRFARNAYLSEVSWQCQIALWSYDSLKQAIEARRNATAELVRLAQGRAPGIVDPGVNAQAGPILQKLGQSAVRILMDLQSLLAATGIISSIFWPEVKRGTPAERAARQRRGEFLRRRGKLSEDSPLHFAPGKADDTRGGLLHIDEMIDDAVALYPGRRVPRFGLAGPDVFPEWHTWDFVRFLDDQTMVLSVRARETDLDDLIGEIRRLYSSLQTVSAVGLKRLPAKHPGEARFGLLFGSSDEDLSTWKG